MQTSPLMGSLREKEGQHPGLEVFYFHNSCFVRMVKWVLTIVIFFRNCVY